MIDELILKTQQHWQAKGLYQKATNEKQKEKLFEELDEIKTAFLSETEVEQKHEIGDAITVLINLCKLNNFTLDECLYLAYTKNIKRDGEMLGGEYVHK